MTIKEIVKSIIREKKEAGASIDSLLFVGCGGSYAAHYPAKYFVERESKTLKTGLFTSNEFVYAPPMSCNANSVVIACSMRGTAETGEAVKTAKSLGATTISFYVEESDMTRASDYNIVYTSMAEDSNRIETSNGCEILVLAAEFLHQLEGYKYYDDVIKASEDLDKIYRDAKVFSLPNAKKFAQECRDDKVIYTMAAGPSVGAAYIFSICDLMEMQWLHSTTVNFGELLHGPFESVDKTLPIVCLVSDGRTRPMDMRALKFLNTYAERLYILDAQELGLEPIADSVREYFCPLIFSSLLQNVYLPELAVSRCHPTAIRRYMWKVEY